MATTRKGIRWTGTLDQMIKFFSLESAQEMGSAAIETVAPVFYPALAGTYPTPRGLPVAIICRKGDRWEDSLTPTSATNPLVVSEKVIDSIRRYALKGLEICEVDFDLKASSKLAKILRNKYFQITPLGKPLTFRFRVFERIGNYKEGNYKFRFETNDANDPRLSFMAEGFVQHIQRVPSAKSWDGNDFISVSPNGALPFGGFHCTRRVLEAAREDDWANFAFTPIDHMGMCVGDFRQREWPPEKWYPGNHPAPQW